MVEVKRKKTKKNKKKQGIILTPHAYFVENESFPVGSVAYKQYLPDMVRSNTGKAADPQLWVHLYTSIANENMKDKWEMFHFMFHSVEMYFWAALLNLDKSSIWSTFHALRKLVLSTAKTFFNYNMEPSQIDLGRRFPAQFRTCREGRVNPHFISYSVIVARGLWCQNRILFQSVFQLSIFMSLTYCVWFLDATLMFWPRLFDCSLWLWEKLHYCFHTN